MKSTRRESRPRLPDWRGGEAAARYHAACRDPTYVTGEAEIEADARANVLSRPRPSLFKTYARAKRVSIPEAEATWKSSELERVLLRRRTVRKFRQDPVEPRRFARLLRMTFGISAVLRSPLFGPLVGRTSPSGGGLHPVEAYPLVWNVRGVAPGVYHYDTASRLRVRTIRRRFPRIDALLKRLKGIDPTNPRS